MLKRLQITNLATIESIQLEFAAGLNALTGETGAGKSILVGGLELAMGDRADSEAIRPGAALASVEAVFGPPHSAALMDLLQNQMELEFAGKDDLTLRRELTRAGRSRCFVNDQMVSVGDLGRIGEHMVDLHGQHEHQSLLHAAAHLAALDAYAQHDGLVETYGKAWAEAAALRRRRDDLDQAARDFERRFDYLKFQIDEIEQLNPRPGEMTELEHEEKRLARAESLARAAAEAYGLIYEGQGDERPPALALLHEAARRIAEIAEVEEEFTAAVTQIEESRATIEDLAFSLRDYADRTQADPARLEEVIARIDGLKHLVRKHGGTESALFEAAEAMRRELETMTQDQAEREQITRRLEAAEKAMRQAGECLSASRRRAADRLARAIEPLLHQLCMEQARFEVALDPLAEPSSSGLERVEFLLKANPGLPPAPLRKTASGGELSRVMLAIKSVLADRDAIPTLIFDEIDAGISGEAARRVGALLEKLATSHQILCITHHAPIAARASWHAAVRKTARRGATHTEIDLLNHEDRLAELARMMGGSHAPAAARELARQLMRQA